MRDEPLRRAGSPPASWCATVRTPTTQSESVHPAPAQGAPPPRDHRAAQTPPPRAHYQNPDVEALVEPVTTLHWGGLEVRLSLVSKCGFHNLRWDITRSGKPGQPYVIRTSFKELPELLDVLTRVYQRMQSAEKAAE